MRKRALLALAPALGALPLFSGCGGSLRGACAAGTGSVKIVVKWPGQKEIPEQAESIKVVVVSAVAHAEVASAVIERPQVEAMLTHIPVGMTAIRALGHDGSGGTGTVIAGVGPRQLIPRLGRTGRCTS